MSKILSFVLPTTLAALLPLPALTQPVQTQYGFPVTETKTWDLPCHMITPNGNTLDLVRLCGGSPQTVSPSRSATQAVRRVPVRRTKRDTGYSRQYKLLADTYPVERVRNILLSMSGITSYTESVCKRLEEGKTVEEIRTNDITKLSENPSGDSTRDNVQKQNIEITLKVAPQYYCPEATE